MRERFRSFRESYPFYLGEHSHPTTRALHYLGTSLVLVVAVAAIWTGRPALLLALPLIGYGPAWTGHFFFERNRPATFQHPVYSLVGDIVMLFQAATGRLESRHFLPSGATSKTPHA